MGRQILLIDDSAMLRRIAANVLGSQPGRYEVIGATRASEGFARACGGEIALIVLDERLAGLDGTDLCLRLLDEPRTARVPVILMTGRNAEANHPASRPTNVVEVLHKPFAPEQLASVVNTIVDAARRDGDFAAIRRALRSDDDQAATEPFIDQPLPADVVTPPPLFRPDERSIRSTLRDVVAQGLTGVLRFCPAGGVPTEVFIDNGRLVLVTTRDGAAYSDGAAEFLSVKVSPATLHEAEAEQCRTGMPFLLKLGVRGLVSKAAGVELLQRFGQRHFARLWTLPATSLQISFQALEALPGYTLRLEPMRESLDQWLLAGLRLLDKKDLVPDARHQGLVGTPSLLRGTEAERTALRLTDAENAFLRQVDGRRDLPTIARNLEKAPEDVFLLVHRFRCLEILAYRPAPLPFLMTPRTNMRRVLPLKR